MFNRVAAIWWIWTLSSTAMAAKDRPDFNRDVRPILSDRCFECHGPDGNSREADLRLDDEDDAKRDRDGSYVIDAQHPAASLLIQRITSRGDDRMPPPDAPGQLKPDEVAILTAWVDSGAPYQRQWAYVAPVRHEPPDVRNADWPSNWIDRFVLAMLERDGLSPAADADKVTLIRRVSFDLTGLPPSPEDVEAFLADDAPGAWERLVDRLLASDECGERLASWWFDLVRFADTVGYHGDQDHNISPYRDYVIEAFISNRPFDQFTREQLAGDLLPDSGDRQKIASGYHRLLQTSHEGGLQPKEYLAIYSADHVRNFSSVWLGGTLGCAQCHDHKFDPYTQKDFYSMAAMFADIDEAQHFTQGDNSIPTRRPPEMKLLTEREQARLREIEQILPALAADPAGNDAAASAADSCTDPAVAARREELEQEARDLKRWARSTMVTVAIEPRTIRLLPRGNWLDDSGPVMQPDAPSFLGSLQNGDARATRLDLANWLFDREQGVGLLTARVFANRFWFLGFGEGLSRTLDDFGGQGEPPSHPELLDRLAFEFAESGWDVRHMLKLMVMSRTYRQSSQADTAAKTLDPGNRLWSRQGRFRIPAESVRDTALKVSGLLVQKVGGASVKPYQPAGYYRNLNFPTREYEADHDENQWRRGVYMHWQRQYLHPMLKAFDAPTREECTAQRARSNTPLTSLVLLNDPTFVEAARVLAARILKEGGESNESRLDFAFRTVLSRPADSLERDSLNELVTVTLREAKEQPESLEQILSVGDAPVDDVADHSELVAWTSVARVLLNLGETYLRH